jgi:biotin carboxyl carrier protein
VQYEFAIKNRTRHVVVRRAGDRFVAIVDGVERSVDAARVDAQTLSLLIGDGERVRSFEVSVVPDAPGGRLNVRVGTTAISVQAAERRRRTAVGLREGEGPQRLTAPMPGKIVRILAAKGERVRARQPIVVIEAMKMENELRAAGDAVVAEILVAEGQLVEAGAQLALLQPAEMR